MPIRGPVLLSFLYPLAVGVQCWPAESATVKLSVMLEDSRTKATSRSPGWVVMFTENEVCAVVVVSMLFWTRTIAGTEHVPTTPAPVRAAVWGLVVALSVTVNVPVRVPATVGVKVTLIAQLLPAVTEPPQLLVSPKSLLMAILEILSVVVPVLVRVIA